MKMLLGILLCFIGCSPVMAQVHVQFKLQQNASDTVYLSGNINNWDPANAAFRFSPLGELHITAPANKEFQYKFTRGGWHKVEVTASGTDVPNRNFLAVHDTSIIINIDGWKDAFAQKSIKQHTASATVSILDSAFAIPELNRARTIRIYLPPDYSNSIKRYPVLYMQDGQNCFDEATSAYGEWHVDETLDRVYDSCGRSIIVVAIDHGANFRFNEYNPYDHKEYGKGQGKEYLDFVVNRLKPFIDSSFRTLSSQKYTSIAGSSMGGLVTMYAILGYPATFGFAGVFSPAFWSAPTIYPFAKQQLPTLSSGHIFFYAGGMESNTMVSNMTSMAELVSKNKRLERVLYVDEAAQHNEAAWARWFAVFVNWMLSQQD